jgi:hypothetical protein
MQVERTSTRLPENVILDARRPGFGRQFCIMDESAIFRFEADHPIHKANIPH